MRTQCPLALTSNLRNTAKAVVTDCCFYDKTPLVELRRREAGSQLAKMAPQGDLQQAQHLLCVLPHGEVLRTCKALCLTLTLAYKDAKYVTRGSEE